MRRPAILCLLLCTASAHAIPYTLPRTAERPFSQLQPEGGGTTLCATWLDEGACDVPAGDYLLLTYDAGWNGDAPERVTIGTVSAGPSVSIVRESCVVENPAPLSCRAQCPTGAMATGGACSAVTAFFIGGDLDSDGERTGTTSSAGASSYSCEIVFGDLVQFDGSDAYLVDASVYCLTP